MRQRKPSDLVLIEDIFTDEQLSYYQKNSCAFIYDVVFHEMSKYHVQDGFFISEQQEQVLDALSDATPKTSVVSGKGLGKLHSISSKIPMFYGGFKNAGDIRPGDVVIGSDGKPTTILMIHPHENMKINKMVFSGGLVANVGDDHLWNVWKRSARPMKTMSTSEIKKYLEVIDNKRENGGKSKKCVPTVGRPFIQMCEPVQYEKRELPIDPWFLGVMIGDGILTDSTPRLSNPEEDIVNRVSTFCEKIVIQKDTCDRRLLGIPNHFKQVGLHGKRSWEKFIPEDYLYSTVEDRVKLLQGLCDTDGYVTSGSTVEYCTVSEQLAKQVQQLTRSLGGVATISVNDVPKYTYKGETLTGRTVYRVFVTFTNDICPVSSEKHLKKWTGKNQRTNVYIKSIEFSHYEDAVCFTVDAPDSLYLCDDYIVTHNTALGSLATLWFATCFPEPKVAITAPTAPQLNAAFWPELNLWLGRSLVRDIFTHTSERMYYNARPKNWWAEPRTARKPESMQGLHATHQLIIIDEGSGVDDNIFRAIDDTQTGEHNLTLAISNGTKTNGWFFDSHHTDKIDWVTHQFDAMDSPFVNKQKAQKLIEKYGWEHDIVRVGIRGMFPKGNEDSFIQYEDVRAAMSREYTPKKDDIVSMGLDVARMGPDQTVLFIKWGLKVFKPIIRSKSKLNDTLDWLISNIKTFRKEHNISSLIRIKIDDTGMNGLVDFLKPYSHDLNIEVVSCVFSSGNGDDVYADIISRMWGSARDQLEKLSVEDNDRLCEELSSRRVSYANGKIKIESKETYKLKYGDSPDYADAFILMCFDEKSSNNVITHFDRYSTNYVRGTIDYIGNAEIFCSIVYSKNHDVSVVKGVWDGYRFLIIDEFFRKADIAETISFIKRTPNEEVIGNDTMFGTRGNDIRSQYSRYGVYVRQNKFSDINGGIQLINMLAREKRFITHAQCTNVLGQLDTWNMETSGVEQLSRFGLCHAIAALASKLKPKIVPEKPIVIAESDYGRDPNPTSFDYSSLNPWEFM